MSQLMRVFRFGLPKGPTENADLVRSQMRAAHDYRNTLTEIEHGRRAALRLVMSSAGDVALVEQKFAAARMAEDEALKSIRSERSRTHARTETQSSKDDLLRARQVRKEASKELREVRKKLREDSMIIAATDAINERANELQRSARANCGVYWGTYLLVENEYQAARKMPLYDGVLPNDPQFCRWSGEGRIGVQLQKGLAAALVSGGTDQRMQIEDVGPQCPNSTGRNAQKRRAILKIRVGSTEGVRAPIFAAFPMVVHRPLPGAAIIKRAAVSMRKIGPREEWSVAITVDESATQQQIDSPTGVVAIDLGWRAIGKELRVARWSDDRGGQGELRLTAWDIGGLRKPDQLRSIRDRHFDCAMYVLAEMKKRIALPDWFRSATESSHAWHAQSRLCSLVRRWAAERFEGDVGWYEAFEAWRRKDDHLWRWETSQRTSALRFRREHYRIFAAKLGRAYKTLVLEAFDLRMLTRRAPIDADPENEVARGNRQTVAVSELRHCLLNVFSRPGKEIARKEAANTTKQCHACGSIEEWDQAKDIQHTCSACGVVWDQDYNASLNLLKRYQTEGADTDSELRSRVDNEFEAVAESRWARAKRLRDEKDARARKGGKGDGR
jgi:Putative transposase DNA-binding domain